MSAIFTHGPEQAKLAAESKLRAEKRRGQTFHTEIAAAGVFTRAEDYHQKYSLRYRKDLMAELKALFKDEKSFVDSTLSMRLNAAIAGDLSSAALEKSLASIDGLDPEKKAAILKLIKK